MNFQDLHELLRLEVLRRIEGEDLTGTKLALQTGFRQAHISNFLNRRRALSLEGLDRVLAAQQLTVDQIFPVEVSAAATVAPSHVAQDEQVVMIPVVTASAAADEPQVQPSGIVEMLPFISSRLEENRARPSRRGAAWERFVALRLDAQQAAAMRPLLSSGTLAVLDRHYNSLAPYRAHEPTLYAVRYGTGVLLRYVEFDAGRLILRPLAINCAVQLIELRPDEMPGDYIVGRVCLLIHEV